MPWTPLSVVQSVAVFAISAVFEIGGGWFVWKAVREHKPHYFAAVGCALLVAYGFAPTFQPKAAAAAGEFGRLDAAYGGVFIAFSFLWGRVVDNMSLNLGDAIGSLLCLAGVVVILAWPRSSSGGALPCHEASGAPVGNASGPGNESASAFNAHNCSDVVLT